MRASDFARQRARFTRRAGARMRFLRKAMGRLVREAGAIPLVAAGKVQGWVMPDGSVVCVKERLHDGHAAFAELERIATTQNRGHTIPRRAYRCTFCSGWHLTSQGAKNP